MFDHDRGTGFRGTNYVANLVDYLHFQSFRYHRAMLFNVVRIESTCLDIFQFWGVAFAD
jgi:hypothetical protein